ncbi:diguanylate cyclase [Solirubrobacter ginsenosidimutans]|uniref:Diguanylate cyclase n=1 Tax=Solirubrobacter ginsenosidimutans TaxID=490573 RepID=A0A9X3S9N7_9ACTN|nr:diguanylate cyclase [Solirubrobacter ginsenosidimutans]MDA0165208.1 diguanylate cyclase [Solirubrobacter ginsenosidimutans]
MGLALVYAALYKLVDIETSFGDGTTGVVFWPAAGVTVSVLILRPRREWPAYCVAICAGDGVTSLLNGASVWSSLGSGVANGCEPVLSAVLVQRWLGRVPDLSRRRDLRVFIVAAACIGPALGAAIGAGFPWLIGETPLWPRLGRWYIGDAVGVLVVAPLIISLARPPAKPLFKLSGSWTFAVLAIALAVAMPWGWSAELGLPFALIPVLGLIGMHLGTRAAAASVCVVGALVETLTAAGSGPFATDGAFNGLLVAQTYLATCAVSSLTAAALMTGLVSREDLALRDSLTGLPNRRLLIERLAQARQRMTRFHNGIGLIYADLDGFKQVNDVHGHAAGDQVLVTTAQRLNAVVRGNDTVARLGGDEFVVLVDDLAAHGALQHLMDRMISAIETPITLDDGPVVRVGASLGSAVTNDTHESPDDFLERADRAMYAVKRAGRSSRRPSLA